MKEKQFQIAGLIGFIISGLFFITSGIKNTDILTILGSLAWIGACIIWLIPFLTHEGRTNEAGPGEKSHPEEE
jgi:membrane protein DedA with SNARE-associated domain